MNDLITKLAQARRSFAELSDEKEELLSVAVSNIPGYSDLLGEISRIKEEIANLEKTVREEAEKVFSETGSKKPHEAVQIKMFSVISVPDEQKAREWCFGNFRPALKLDSKTFEKAVKDGNIPTDLATCEQEPRAQIATDLSKYI